MSLINQQNNRQSGFTVIVIAALFLAFAIIAAAAVERNTTLQMITRRDAARDQLQKLSTAIIEYAVFNRNSSNFNLYPCPALANVAATGSTFGASQYSANGYAADCSSSAGDSGGFTVAGANGVAVLGTDVISGMVPVLELSAYGVNTNDAFDPWNDRIMYVVNRTQTKGSGTTSQTNNPTLTDARTGYTLANPDFILISYGRDRVGGIPRSATLPVTPSIACTNATTKARYENCDNDTTFYFAPTYSASGADTASASYVINSYFDDILVWYRQ